MANVLVITSSQRKNSNSSLLAKSVAEGAEAAGHTVRTLDISRMNIEPCRGCEGCHQPNSKGCVVRDDMQEVYPLVVEAEILVLASPVYWFMLCGQLKQCIDRWYAVAIGPAHEMLFAGKKIAAVLTYAGDDIFDSGGVNALRMYQDICAYSGAEWLGAVYGAAAAPGAISADRLEEARKLGERL